MTGTETKDVRLFDIRTVERNIKKGLITRKDQTHFLKTLPDATEKIAEATEYVPGLTAPEMNEAELASASSPSSSLGGGSSSHRHGEAQSPNDAGLPPPSAA